VAGRSVLLDPNEQCVLVTVIRDLDHPLHVAGGAALFPKTVSRAAPEVGVSGIEGLVQGISVHVRKHQDFAGVRILHNRRDQAFVIEVQAHGKFHFVTGVTLKEGPIALVTYRHSPSSRYSCLPLRGGRTATPLSKR